MDSNLHSKQLDFFFFFWFIHVFKILLVSWCMHVTLQGILDIDSLGFCDYVTTVFMTINNMHEYVIYDVLTSEAL